MEEYKRPSNIIDNGITLESEQHVFVTHCGEAGCFGHFSFKTYPAYEAIKLDLFESGRNELLDNLVEQASDLMRHKNYAEAVAVSRIANELPDKLSLTFGLSNFGLMSDKNSTKNIEEISLGFISVNAKTEKIEERARKIIAGDEINAWSKAIEYFASNNQTHAAGVSALELGQEYEKLGKTEEASTTYLKASEFIRLRLSQVKREDDVYGHFAETKGLEISLVNTQAGFLRTYSNSYPFKGAIKELVKQAVYELDDLDAPRDIVLNGYEALVRSSHLSEKHFYKKEIKGISGQLLQGRESDRIQREGIGIMDKRARNRPNRRHLRSQVLLELPS